MVSTATSTWPSPTINVAGSAQRCLALATLPADATRRTPAPPVRSKAARSTVSRAVEPAAPRPGWRRQRLVERVHHAGERDHDGDHGADPERVISVRRGARRTLRSGILARLAARAGGRAAEPRDAALRAARAPTRIASIGAMRTRPPHRERGRHQRQHQAEHGRLHEEIELERRARMTGSGSMVLDRRRADVAGEPDRDPEQRRRRARSARRAAAGDARAPAAGRRAPCRCRSRGAGTRPCG